MGSFAPTPQRFWIGRRTATTFLIGDGRFAATRSVFEGGRSDLVSTPLERAVEAAKENGQLAIWDRSVRPWTMALYESESRQLRALSDEEAAILLNRDAGIAREWRKWSRMTGEGSLIVLDTARALRILATANNEPRDDEREGRA